MDGRIDLQDSEILEIRRVQNRLNAKFSMRERSEKVISEIEAEAVEELYRLGFVAHIDAFPILQGEQLTITLLARATPDAEFDHERKQYDVIKAREKGETLHGESESSSE